MFMALPVMRVPMIFVLPLFPVHFSRQILFAMGIDVHLGGCDATPIDTRHFQSCPDVQPRDRFLQQLERHFSIHERAQQHGATHPSKTIEVANAPVISTTEHIITHTVLPSLCGTTCDVLTTSICRRSSSSSNPKSNSGSTLFRSPSSLPKNFARRHARSRKRSSLKSGQSKALKKWRSLARATST